MITVENTVNIQPYISSRFIHKTECTRPPSKNGPGIYHSIYIRHEATSSNTCGVYTIQYTFATRPLVATRVHAPSAHTIYDTHPNASPACTFCQPMRACTFHAPQYIHVSQKPTKERFLCMRIPRAPYTRTFRAPQYIHASQNH